MNEKRQIGSAILNTEKKSILYIHIKNHPTVNLNLRLLTYHIANYYINNLGNNTSKIHALLFSKQETAMFDITD